MGRPRTPTRVLELTGAYKTHPERKRERENEPAPEGALGDPPPHFSEELAAIWFELAALCPAGVLTSADRWLTEMACQLMLKFRTLGLIPKVGMSGAEMSLLANCLARMGMSPADRSRVGVTKKEKSANPFEQLARETRRVN